MKVDSNAADAVNSTLQPAKVSPHEPVEAPTRSSAPLSDKVSLSVTARQLAATLTQQHASTAAASAERLAELRRAMESQTLAVDPRALAAAILDEEFV